MDQQPNSASTTSNTVGTVISWTAFFLVLAGITRIAIAVPFIPLFGWTAWFYSTWKDGQALSKIASSDSWPIPPDLATLPFPMALYDGPVGKVYEFDLTGSVIYLLIVVAIGWAVAQFRGVLGMLALWGPLCLMIPWEFQVGKAYYYPGGKYHYVHDHWDESCLRHPDGKMVLDKRGLDICTRFMTKKPPIPLATQVAQPAKKQPWLPTKATTGS